ncbi:MAG: hypothetical protein J5879_05815 [Clostridia bacterium]|nr:hypothetical protein [Clostridia bacterium]
MKKIFATAVCVLMICALALPVIAGTDDDVVKAASIEHFATISAADVNNAIEMRGFTASPDGKYVYGGFLQGGRYTVRFDVENGMAQAGSYKPAHNVAGDSADNEYCKGLAVDDRGYLYVGITHSNKSFVTVAAVDADMHEVGHLTEDLGKSKTGINGVAVQKVGDKYLLYAVTAYDADGVRCYDVTDPANISLYKSFGVNGVMDYETVIGAKDPSYIAVDTDGNVYLTYLRGIRYSKGSHVGLISPDGKTLVKEVAVNEAYGICEAGDYLFVATFDGPDSCVHVLNKSDLSEVTTYKYADQWSNMSDIAYGGGTLYVGDHGDNSKGEAGNILKVELDLSTGEEVGPGTGSKGDVTGDGKLNNKDVVALFRYVSSGATGADPAVYDFNGDGKINNKDVVALFRYVSAQ